MGCEEYLEDWGHAIKDGFTKKNERCANGIAIWRQKGKNKWQVKAILKEIFYQGAKNPLKLGCTSLRCMSTCPRMFLVFTFEKETIVLRDPLILVMSDSRLHIDLDQLKDEALSYFTSVATCASSPSFLSCFHSPFLPFCKSKYDIIVWGVTIGSMQQEMVA